MTKTADWQDRLYDACGWTRGNAIRFTFTARPVVLRLGMVR